MSGGSGSRDDYRPNVGGQPEGCGLDEIIPVNSPNPATVATLRVGDVVSITLASSPTRIVVVNNAGLTVGSLTWSGLARIIRCMENGESYSGTVHSINNGAVELRVTKL